MYHLLSQRSINYQYSRTLEAYTEEFEEYERQLVDLGRPTLESELVLMYLDHHTIPTLRTTKQLPSDHEEMNGVIREHEDSAAKIPIPSETPLCLPPGQRQQREETAAGHCCRCYRQ
jgi:hypothetical protein